MAFFSIRLAVLAAAATALVACGGGDEAPAFRAQSAPAAQAVLTKVEPFVQPADPHQLPAVKRRALSSPAPQAVQFSMGAISQEKTLPQAEGGARLIGAARALAGAGSAEALASKLVWTRTPTGAVVAAISVSAEGAQGLRLGLHVDALPGSAAVRVYSQQRPETVYEVSGQQILQTIERNLAAGDDADAARTWWTPELGESEQTLEFELPPGTNPNAIQVSIPSVSHIFENLSLPQEGELTAKINESAGCNLDSTCFESVAQLRNAVARMVFTEAGRSYLCTGTLLNSAGSTGIPYFLSANHCISSQSVASSLQTDWFYRAPTCNSRSLSSQSESRLGGAALLYSSAATDTAFFRLNEAPPAGAMFAGWKSDAVGADTSVVGVHHPSGDLQKVSFGKIIGQAECSSSGGFACGGSSGNYHRVQWSQGTTEGGSSGSAIVSEGKYVVGTLYGGSASCRSPQEPDFYGKFDVAYRAALKQWLSPDTQPVTGRVPVYRFFNSKTGAHFFTASADERNFVVNTYPDFRYENIAFYAYVSPAANQNAVFRFYNPQSGAHFYTISAGERDFVRNTYPVFNYEGPSWYAQPTAGGDASAMYRFFNTRTGAHFYTTSAGERDFVIANYRDFRFENTAYYAWTAP